MDALEIPEFKAVEEDLQTAIKMCQRNTDNETLTDAEVHVSVFILFDICKENLV